MDLYSILLFVHVLAIATWIGGAIMIHVITEQTVATNDVVRIKGFVDQAEVLGKRYFAPASGIALLSGIWLVLEGDWGFGQPFVLVGLGGLALSTVLGMGVLEPTATKLKAAFAVTDTLTEEIKGGIDRIRTISWIDIGILVIVVFFMTVKPGT